MSQKNKIKFGLKNVHYAVATIDELTNTATYGAVKPWPGGVSLSMEAQGDTTKFRADNIDYWIGRPNNGYEGDLESAKVPEDFKKDVLGEIEDSNGVMLEDQGAKTVHFALMFQFEGDITATRLVLYNCVASRPSVEGSTTSESIEPQTEKVSINATAIHNASLDKDIVKARVDEKESGTYASWFTTVYQATAAATYHTVTFDTDGGSAVPSQSVRDGCKAEQPANPTKASYTFSGWYKEDTFTTVFNFATETITTDKTIYAKFTSA